MASSDSYNLVAAFEDRDRARQAAEDLTRRGLPSSSVRVVETDQPRDKARIAELRSEMQEETVNSFAGPSVGFMTPSQAKGGFGGSIAGTVVGLAIGIGLGLIWASVDGSPIPPVGRVLIAAAVCAVGVSTIGFIVGGAGKSRADNAAGRGDTMDDTTLAGQDSTLVSVESVTQEQAGIAHEVLSGLGALRVDDVDRDGEPIAPQAEHPRPADPPGYWQNGGRNKG